MCRVIAVSNQKGGVGYEKLCITWGKQHSKIGRIVFRQEYLLIHVVDFVVNL